MVKNNIFIIHMLFLICWYEQGNMDAILVHWHVWYLQCYHSWDIITSTTRNSARSIGTRIRIHLIVPSTSTVPGGTVTAIGPIPMGCISHPAHQVMAVLWITGPFWVFGRAYVQWNSCSDKYVRIIIIILTWYLFRFFITSLKLFYMKTQ